MTDRVAYVWITAVTCQECGEKIVQEHGDNLLNYTDPAEAFDQPETWFCEECGEPLFPNLYETAQ